MEEDLKDAGRGCDSLAMIDGEECSLCELFMDGMLKNAIVPQIVTSDRATAALELDLVMVVCQRIARYPPSASILGWSQIVWAVSIHDICS